MSQRTNRNGPCLPRRQGGAVLVVALMLLALSALLALGATRDVGLAQRISEATQDDVIAEQAAEAALQQAEARVGAWAQAPATCTSACSGVSPVYVLNQPGDLRQDTPWNSGYGRAEASGLDQLLSAPLSVIEEEGFIPDTETQGNQTGRSGVTVYRVSARSTGRSGVARVVLQSRVGRRF